MSTTHVTQLPDPVMGSADVGSGNSKAVKITAGKNLIHAHIGGLYVAMSERNWQALYAAMETLEFQPEERSFRIVFNDMAGTATAVAE